MFTSKTHSIPLTIDHQCVTYGDQVIHYQVCYIANKKHKVAIHVHPDGSVQVDAPEQIKTAEIKQAVLKRARWVIKHLNQIKEQQKYVLRREYISGETHFYLGRRYPLKVLKRKNESVKLMNGKLVINTKHKSATHVRDLLWQWYRTRSEDVFQRRLEAIVNDIKWIKGKIPQWKLLTMKKQWGSCSPKGVLSINPHLIKAPRDCVDYVILHELCHLREHNHSKRFYTLLDQHMPDWTSRKAKLDGMAYFYLNDVSNSLLSLLKE